MASDALKPVQTGDIPNHGEVQVRVRDPELRTILCRGRTDDPDALVMLNVPKELVKTGPESGLHQYLTSGRLLKAALERDPIASDYFLEAVRVALSHNGETGTPDAIATIINCIVCTGTRLRNQSEIDAVFGEHINAHLWNGLYQALYPGQPVPNNAQPYALRLLRLTPDHRSSFGYDPEGDVGIFGHGASKKERASLDRWVAIYRWAALRQLPHREPYAGGTKRKSPQKTERFRQELRKFIAAFPDVTPSQLLEIWNNDRCKNLRAIWGAKPDRATLWRHWPKVEN